MKIKKLELLGFKSFVDRTVVRFDHDVLGIVGPNGCGKSNIVDAMRWAMGEQSAKHLRGKSMEDVIFNGSDTREPNELAEVTITFENDDPADLPIEYKDYPEIAVTRRLHRNGDSEYLINKTQVRLKDVTDLFLGTGVGTKAYSIVEQGKIGLIVSAKPEDRRLLIEEAAGITKFKSKKKQAENKLALTQQNLLRVGDIIGELERNLGSLKRQAAKAERYVSYRAELEDLRLYEASHRYLEHSGWITMETAQVSRLTEDADGTRSGLLTLDTELETARAEAMSSEGELDGAVKAHFAAENEVREQETAITRHRDKLQTMREREFAGERELVSLRAQEHELVREQQQLRADLTLLEENELHAGTLLEAEETKVAERQTELAVAEAALAALRHEIGQAMAQKAKAEAQLAGFQKRAEDMEDRLDRQRFDREELEGQADELLAREGKLASEEEELRTNQHLSTEQRSHFEHELVRLKALLLETERALDEAKNEHQKKRSKLQALGEMHARMDGMGSGVKALCAMPGAAQSDAGKEPVILGLLADRIEAPAEYTHALAAALGPMLSAVVVSDLFAGAHLLEALRDSRKGRAVIVDAHPAYVAGTHARAVELVADHAVRLVSTLQFHDKDHALIESVLGDVWVASTDDDARIASTLLSTGVTVRNARVVTLAGTVYGPAGRVEGGTGEDVAAALLDSKREARTLEIEVAELETLVAARLAEHQAVRQELTTAQAALEQARHAAHTHELALVTAARDLVSVRNELLRDQKRTEQLRVESLDIEAQIAADALLRAGSEQALYASNSVLESAESKREEAEKLAEIERERVALARDALTEHKVRVSGAQEKLASSLGALTRITRSSEELSMRSARISEELDAAAIFYGETAALLLGHTEAQSSAVDTRRHKAAHLATVRTTFDLARATVLTHEAALKELRSSTDSVRDALTKHELTLREHQMQLSHLLTSVAEKFRGLNLARVVGDYHMRPPPDEATRSRISELTQLIDRMGTVNLEAMKEHTEAEERYTYYSTQKADIDKAIADLDKAIAQMNKESKRLFKETFDLVNEKFQIIFPKMFRGGRASLRLTNPDDLLETGIDILAQPPGKKLSSIELMSGGEKALTAVSLIFAIFQIKPSPFCILDEVDAPLDEANVARYNEMVREMTDRSQFILITHIKRTMQMVDVLYGVTMQESGVSRLVSVKLSDAAERGATGDKRLPQSIPAAAVA